MPGSPLMPPLWPLTGDKKNRLRLCFDRKGLSVWATRRYHCASMPSIPQLEYILAVHRTRHFGRAATDVGVSQPTLSMQIQKAELELGVTIFDRQSKPIETTERGRVIVERAQDVVGAHENLLRLTTGNYTEPAGAFSLGIIPTLAPYVLPWFLPHFAEHYSAVELSVVERPTDELISEVLSGRLDTALLVTPVGERSISERVLFYDPFYVYCHRDDPLLDADLVEVADLDPRKLWLLDDAHCFRAQVTNFCGLRERRHLGSIRFAGGSFETIRHLIDASEGYTLIPETYARTLPRAIRQRCVRPFENRTPTREVSLVHHRKLWKQDVLDGLEESITQTLPRALRLVSSDGEILSIRAASARM